MESILVNETFSLMRLWNRNVLINDTYMCPVCPKGGNRMPKSAAISKEPSQACLICAPCARKGVKKSIMTPVEPDTILLKGTS